MPRTTPYAPLHALKNHPLAPWVERYFKDEERAERDAMRPAPHRTAPYGHNGMSNQAFILAERYVERGEMSVPFSPIYIEETEHLLQDLLCWEFSGKKIFEFGDELTTELQQTDIHEVTADDLRMPATSFYLAFNQQQPYLLPDGQELDGILITGLLHADADEMRARFGGKHYGRMTMVIMGKAGKYSPTKVSLSLSVTFEKPEDTLTQACERTLAEYDRMYAEAASARGNQGGAKVGQAIENMQGRFVQRRQVFADLYNLIAGAMLYLTLYHDKGNQRWSPAAPEKFVRKTEGQKSEALAAIRTLADRGWSRTTYFNVTSPAPSESGTGGNRSTHWRRGHWRRQAVGPARAERKLTWIRPILVNAHQGEGPTKTHIVKVESPKAGRLIKADL